ncbi:MAG: UvrD-helicase domain-containing protein, partial [Gemmatimonadaceae bacterium]
PPHRVAEEGESLAMARESVRDTVLASLEKGSIRGLDSLIGDYGLENIENWAVKLVSDGDRLAAISEAKVTGREGPLLALARAARKAMDDSLVREELIDFDRLILRTRDLLRDNKLAREHLQRRIRLLIVDEFQDVDPAQRDLAYLLGAPLSKDAETTRLMLVGDPKQSIYRFRRADISVWNKVRRDFKEKGTGKLIRLDRNYRSVPAILAFVDDVIGSAMGTPVDGKQLADFETEYAALEANEKQPRGASVEMLLIPGDGGSGPNVEMARAVEAETVAKRMRELHGEGYAWGDMAILLTGWGALGTYEGALARAGIPKYALQAEGFYQRREILDCILALRVARDPRDDVALMGFLRSPFVGVRDETLLALARGGYPPFWDVLSDDQKRENAVQDSAERALLRRAAAIIGRAAALRDRIGIGNLLRLILSDAGYLAHLALLGDDGLQPMANVRKLIRLADASAELGVGPFLKAVDELRERQELEGDERLYGESEDVVTITSVHAAKGLEWKVVFWCDLMRGAVGEKGGLAVGRDRDTGRDRAILGHPDAKKEEQPQEWQALRASQCAEADAERKRLWYVAATRAKEWLILGGVPLYKPSRATESAAGAIRDRLGIRDEAPRKVIVTTLEGKKYQCAVVVCDPRLVPGEQEPIEKAIGSMTSISLAALAVPIRAGRLRHSATELMTYERCPRKHWFKYIQGLREPALQGDSEGKAALIDAVRRGQIVHDVLEALEEEERLDTLLEEAIGRWDQTAPPPEASRGRRYRQHLREEVTLVSRHPEYRAIADREGARRELRFAHFAGPELVAEGSIDLAGPEADGLVLLDVKTAQCDAEEAQRVAANYGRQRDVYVAAAEAIAGRNVERFAFQFSRAGTQVSSDITEGVREEGRAGIEKAAGRLGGEGKPGLTENPGECRFCGYRRVGWCEGRLGEMSPALAGPSAPKDETVGP